MNFTRHIQAVIVAALVLGACSSRDAQRGGGDDLTTDTRSSSIESEADQIAFLDRYVRFATPVRETEFHIVYRDNDDGRVPGPSEWDIQLALRIEPDEIDAWADGFTADESATVEFSADLIPGWLLTSEPETYVNGGSIRSLYRADGIVLQRSVAS